MSSMRFPALAAAAGLAVLFLGSSPAAAQNRAGPDWDHPMMWGMWFAGPLMMLLFVAAVVAITVAVVRWLGHGGQGGSGERALAILRERLARGEISPEEYEARKRLIVD